MAAAALLLALATALAALAPALRAARTDAMSALRES
jgi:ABC-type lipoprotein release transport system permease subunit